MRTATSVAVALALLFGTGCQDKQEPPTGLGRNLRGTFSATAIGEETLDLSGSTRNEREQGIWTIELRDRSNGFRIRFFMLGADRPYSGIYELRSFSGAIEVEENGSTVLFLIDRGRMDLVESDEEGVVGEFELLAVDTGLGSTREVIIAGDFVVPCAIGCRPGEP
jgi:hypothetical protein